MLLLVNFKGKRFCKDTLDIKLESVRLKVHEWQSLGGKCAKKGTLLRLVKSLQNINQKWNDESK